VAIGVDPHGINDTPDLSGPALRQDLHPSDADVGRFTHPGAAPDAVLPPLPKLIEQNDICVARPPLYRVDAARARRSRAEAHALDDGELEAIEDKLRKDGLKEGALEHLPLGAGEMNAEQLWKPP
jgi:topoisomerase-4 subunit B